MRRVHVANDIHDYVISWYDWYKPPCLNCPEQSYIISQGILSPAHFRHGSVASGRVNVENHHFMPHFKALLLDPGAVPDLLTLDLCSTRPELLINHELKLRPLLSWNGDTLKGAKISCFARSAPFFQIRSHIFRSLWFTYDVSNNYGGHTILMCMRKGVWPKILHAHTLHNFSILKARLY